MPLSVKLWVKLFICRAADNWGGGGGGGVLRIILSYFFFISL